MILLSGFELDVVKNSIPLLVVVFSLYSSFFVRDLVFILMQTWAYLILAKAIMSSVTVLPQPFATMHVCQEDFKIIDFIFGKCGDLIFSLHTAIVLGTCLVLYHYSIIGMVMTLLLTLIIASLMVVTRAHYTIDTIVGCFVAFVVVYAVVGPI